MKLAMSLFLPLFMDTALALTPHRRGAFKPKNSRSGSAKSAMKATSKTSSSSERKVVHRSKWGVDNAHPDEYWFDNRIHTLGNVGFFGGLHAAMAPASTKLIDLVAYDGVDIRKVVRPIISFFITICGNGFIAFLIY